VLPDGELYEYLCAACGTSVGTRKAEVEPPSVIVT
jgi:DNA-directed RNA polymerase subunit RPC12/RpoP